MGSSKPRRSIQKLTTPSEDSGFWEEKVAEMIEIVSWPASPKEVTRALRAEKWGPALIGNTMAYADGRKIFFRHGRWHLPQGTM